MFAISFDMLISDLKDNYGDPYNNAYFEIATILEKFDFYRGQGSVYLSTNNDMSVLLRAVNALKNTPGLKIPFVIYECFVSKTGRTLQPL